MGVGLLEQLRLMSRKQLGTVLEPLNFGNFYFRPASPSTSAYTVILCIISSFCVSVYTSINICRRPPNTSLLLMEAKPKKTSRHPFVCHQFYTHTHRPLTPDKCLCLRFHLNVDFLALSTLLKYSQKHLRSYYM